jgi:hypothetical protein
VDRVHQEPWSAALAAAAAAAETSV